MARVRKASKAGRRGPTEAQPWNKSSPVWDGDLINYLHTRKALCSGNEITRKGAVGQLNEVSLKLVLVPVTSLGNINKY